MCIRDRCAFVSTLERDAGQSDQRDRVGRVVRQGLLVDLLGLVKEPEGERILRPEELLDHVGSVPAFELGPAGPVVAPSAAARSRARVSRRERSFSIGSTTTISRRRSRSWPSAGPAGISRAFITSSPLIARPERSSATRASSCSRQRTRSESRPSTSGESPLPTLSAARRSRRSWIADAPQRRMNPVSYTHLTLP